MPIVALVLVLLAVSPATAQPPRENLPLFTVDAHAATVGLPQAEGWVPVVSDDTELPGRAWGFGGGATIYPLRLGLITFGFGASMLTAKGSGESLTIVTGSGDTATTRITPAVHTGLTHLIPQVSINFGGGARWFMKPHLGASFDVRWIKLSSRSATATLPAAKRTQMWNISAGISIQ